MWFDLKDLSPVDRRQIKVSDLLTPRPQNFRQEVCVVAQLLVVNHCGVGRPCCLCETSLYSAEAAKPVAEIQLREVARTKAEPVPDSASPISSIIFQFRAPATT